MVLNKKWSYILSKKAQKEIYNFEPKIQIKILDFFDKIILTPNPRVGGYQLKGSLRTYWRYRIGDYRAVCYFEDNVLQIVVVKIAHRRKVYKEL